MSVIITIARQYGSGGREIGRLLAERLGLDFYDKQLISMTAEKGGLDSEYVAKNDETPGTGLFYSLSGAYPGIGSYSAVMAEPPISEKAFYMQADVIREIGQKGSAVIIGRCADYILRDLPDCFHIFIQAPREFRARLAAEKYGAPEKNPLDAIAKIDKKRANYYNYYTSRKWGDMSNYHAVFDSSVFGPEKCVEAIAALVAGRL